MAHPMKIRILTAATIGLTAFGSYRLYVETYHPVIEHVPVPISGLPPALHGFRIVQLSDFHIDPFYPCTLVQRVVAQTNQLSPDLILLTGDFVSYQVGAIQILAPLLGQLRARYGVFAVLGNHDVWTNPHLVRCALMRAGISVLINDGVCIPVDDAILYLAGLDDGRFSRPDIQTALAHRPHDATTILMIHEPDFASTLAFDRRIMLQLSGHTHGGQIRLPGIGALILPKLGRKYAPGLVKVHGMWLYTTRGVGIVGVPLRCNCRPEITHLTLVTAP